MNNLFYVLTTDDKEFYINPSNIELMAVGEEYTLVRLFSGMEFSTENQYIAVFHTQGLDEQGYDVNPLACISTVRMAVEETLPGEAPVEDTEYIDETPLEPQGTVNAQHYPDELDLDDGIEPLKEEQFADKETIH